MVNHNADVRVCKLSGLALAPVYAGINLCAVALITAISIISTGEDVA
jgi:hypothetical protein